jgi:hypothetical protein
MVWRLGSGDAALDGVTAIEFGVRNEGERV